MALRLFFEYNNVAVQLPVNPPTLSMECGGKNDQVEIVSIGDINLLRSPKLHTIKVESFLPATINKNAPYVLTSGAFKDPQFYIDFFEKVRADKKPIRFIVTDTKINLLMAIESFTYTLNAGDDDVTYSLELTEYKPYAPKVVVIQVVAAATTTNTASNTVAATTPATRPPTGLAVGDVVTVNGNYWYSSWGANPHGTFNNFKGKISMIVADRTRKYRYHITTLTGGYRGWVAENQISR